MSKNTVNDRWAKVEKRLGKTTGASKGSKPPPPAKIKALPTGGLKPDGIKVKIKKDF